MTDELEICDVYCKYMMGESPILYSGIHCVVVVNIWLIVTHTVVNRRCVVNIRYMTYR